MGILEKIAEIEAEMARTQKNKATNHHLCLLRAKVAKLRSELIAGSSSKNSKPGEGFDVLKSGNARVSMIGFPSVGKSTLLSTLTKTESAQAAYEFTTLTCIPGVIEYKDTCIQLLDLPGIIEGAAKGKGRGRQVISVARTSDLCLMVVEAEKAEMQIAKLTRELESVGIRLNKRKPNISFKIKKTGGIKFNSMCDVTEVDESLCRKICSIHKIHNADILFREDCTADELIDVIEGNRVYMRCVYFINKIDLVYLDEVDRLAHIPHAHVGSIKADLNLDGLVKKIWEYLDFKRVYTKPRGARPSFTEPLVMREGSTVKDVCNGVHRDFHKSFKYALVWGKSAKHQPQQVGLTHEISDEDVVQLMAHQS